MDSTTTLYLVLTTVSLVVAVYSQQQKKQKSEVALAWFVFGVMTILLVAHLYGLNSVPDYLGQGLYTPQQVPEHTHEQIHDASGRNSGVVVPAENIYQGGVPDSQHIRIGEDEKKQFVNPNQSQSGLDSLFNPLVDPSKLQNKSIYDVKDSTVNPEDLMPSTDNDWSQLQSLVDIGLKDQNFLTPRHTGLNTVSTANKNACYDLRGTIPVPKVGHMPWGNSSYETEDSNKQLQLNIKL